MQTYFFACVWWRVFYGSLGFMFIIQRVSVRPICCRGGWLCFDPVPDQVQILVASGSDEVTSLWEFYLALHPSVHIYDPDWEMEGHLLSLYDRRWKTKVHIQKQRHDSAAKSPKRNLWALFTCRLTDCRWISLKGVLHDHMWLHVFVLSVRRVKMGMKDYLVLVLLHMWKK